MTLCVGFAVTPALAASYQLGDVFVAVSNGRVQHRNAAGTLIETLDTLRTGFTTGMAFDSLGTLYVTDFSAGTVSRFDSQGTLLGTFGSGYSGSPESILFDRNGNTYVGAVNGDNHIRKFDPLGNPLGQFIVATESRGTDWIDLSPDQCTMFYTSEGLHVKRFDVCRNLQLPDFNALALPGPVAFALRILPDGGMLVADTTLIVRLNSSGQAVQTYDSSGENCWFALNLDADGKSFWSADYCSSRVHKFDIQSGTELLSFSTGTGSLTVFGIVVFGELSASRPIGLPATFGSSGTSTNRSAGFSDPINTGTGNYYFSRTDLAIPGKGLPLIFTRSYNSLDSYSGPLGAGWTNSYNVLLRQNVGGTVTVKEADGHEVLFDPLGSGSYAPATPGVFDILRQNTDGSFTLTRKNETVLSFSSSGKLLSIADRNGNMQTLSYDGLGNLRVITDTVGRGVSLLYDGSNRIIQITDPIGRTITFDYDASNNLKDSIDPASGTTKFSYDSNHRMTTVTLPSNQLLLTNGYDAIGRVASQTNGRGFTATFAYGTPNPTDTTITDARGNQTVHSYDAAFRILKITDAAAGTISFTYDANNNRTSVTNQNGKATSFTYDSQGNVTGIIDPLANTVAFTYDSINDLLTATNAKSKTTNFTYDPKGNLTRIQDALSNTTAFVYDNFGELASKTDARANSTTFTYDASGNLTRITDALGHSTTLAYDGIGRLTSITDPNGHTATATYDLLSRLVKIADPLGHQTQFAYDAVGNLLKITDANGSATNYAYDTTNNLVTVTDALGHVTQYAYDPNNNRTKFTNAKGNATSYGYDALNRLSSITDPLSFVTSYAYDAVGKVGAVTDAKGQTNLFTYDALNRLIGIAYADGKSVAYAYDANGNRTGMIDSHGTTTYAYDALDRLVSVTHPGGKVVEYAYDAVGNRGRLTYPGAKVVNYSYDQANRLARVTDWLSRVTTYSYDASSNLTRTTYPNGAAISFAYDSANRLVEVRNQFSDADIDSGDDGPDSGPGLNFKYALDSVGNRLRVRDGKGRSVAYQYDALYELIGVSKLSDDPLDDDNDPKTIRYTYDAVGNRLSLTTGKASVTYSYDADDRLLAAGTATFTYDPNGNQTSATRTATGVPVIYRYDAANRLIAAVGGVINSGFAYDGDGNRVSQSVGRGTYTYVNDVATALPVVLQEVGPDGNITYAYGLGLVSESSSRFDFFYHYDGLGSVVGLTDSRGHLKGGRYTYDAWGGTLHFAHSIGTENKFRFTGEALDPETQLYYLRARYYDSLVGRFLNRDPFSGLVRSPSPHLNRYAYAGGNPINNSDPSGLSFFGNVADFAADAFYAAGSSLALAGTTIVGGYVDTANLISGGKLNWVAKKVDKAEQVEARVLVTSVAAAGALAGVKGISLTPEERNAIADQVVGVTNFASNVLGLFVDTPWEKSLYSPSAITRSAGLVWVEFNAIGSLQSIVEIKAVAQGILSPNGAQLTTPVSAQMK